MLRQRLLSAALLLPALLVVVWLGGAWYAALLAATALIGADELYRLAAAANRAPFRWPGLALTGALFWLPSVAPDERWGLLYAGLAALSLPTLLLPALSTMGAGRQGLVWTVGGAVYLAWPLSAALLLRGQPQGREWILLLLAATFAVDTAAYGVGRAVGRRRLAPRISPGKTWEGAIGGLVAGVATTIFGVQVLSLPLGALEATVWGVLLGLVAQIGDLYESALKRRLGAKDASGLIPGHGGLLDRLDSVLATSLMLYYLVSWRGRGG